MAHLRQRSNGNITNLLSAGGIVDIRIPGGTGYSNVAGAYLKLSVQASATVEFVPAAQLIDFISFETASGKVIQKLYGDQDLWLKNNLLSQQEWEMKASVQNANPCYGPAVDAEMTNGETRDFYIELHGFALKAASVFLPAVSEDLILKIHFRSSASTLRSGSTMPSLTSLELVLENPHITDNNRTRQMAGHRLKPHDYLHSYTVKQELSKTLAPATTYEIAMTGFSGLFSEVGFGIRSSITGSSQNIYERIASLEFLDSSNTNIIGGSPVTHLELQKMLYPDQYQDKQPEYLNAYRYPFSLSARSAVEHGLKGGYHPFSGDERIRFTTPAAEVDEVQTITNDSGLTFDGGFYRLSYNGEFTDSLEWNTSNANIGAALNALPSFKDYDGTVAVTGSLSTALVFTFGGNFAGKPINKNITLVNESLDDGGATTDVSFSHALTAKGVYGFPASASYIVTIWGSKHVVMRVDKNGQVQVHSS
eukprot:TRINITY_DN4879_c0_g1_i5.p1 TRINITY_DN4879_c0_g1~~TRINITY_DN4879_c0_g1_i5.p1  ORF type:complete len:496 (-),score=-2.84 TRINITY_DN4879_c0_g1_i5:862-2298(-)